MQFMGTCERCLVGMEACGVKRALANSGYLSEANVGHCAAAKIEPLIAMKRERHNARWKKRFAEDLKAPPASASVKQQMAHQLKTQRGKKLYALRKQTPKPVFEIIKSLMDFRQFLLRGFKNRFKNAKYEFSVLLRSQPLRQFGDFSTDSRDQH